jgi:hypothetical protein
LIDANHRDVMGLRAPDGERSIANPQAQWITQRSDMYNAHFGLGQEAELKETSTCAAFTSDGYNEAPLTKRKFSEGHPVSLV